MKYIFILEGIKIPKVEYELYYPFYNQSFKKLNLEPCKNTKVEITIPVRIEDDIDKYNPNSKYYNDICSKATSDNGTDITLNDRKTEFINNNMSLCEENCRLINYDYETEKVKCSCDIKLNIPLFEDIRFNKDLLYKSFTDINNIINIKLLKCYKYVFNKSIIRNCGFFILLSIILLFFICLIIFLSTSFKKLKMNIYNIISPSNTKNNNINKNTKIVTKKVKNNDNIKVKINDNKKVKINDDKKVKNNDNIKVKNNDKKKVKINQSKINESKSEYLNINKKNNSKNNKNSKISNTETYLRMLMTKDISPNNEKKIEYDDFELNSMKYKDARKFDQRGYIQIYISILKKKNLFLFSFWPIKDYNSRIIKMFLFFFFFALHLTINALFFNDPTIHKIYEDKGTYDFIYQLPQMLYSSLLSGGLNAFIKILSLSQSNIVEFKQYKGKNFIKKRKNLIHKLNIKFIFFFIITFIILLFSLFYVSCFCGIYENTQIQFVNDTIFSFLLSLLYPFLISLIPVILRIISLRQKNDNLGCLYKLSLLFY